MIDIQTIVSLVILGILVLGAMQVDKWYKKIQEKKEEEEEKKKKQKKKSK